MVRHGIEAIIWGKAHANTPPPGAGDSHHTWRRMCLQFTRLCFGVDVIVPDAGKSWDLSKHKHVVPIGMGHTIPPFVPVHFELASVADHIAPSMRGGNCLSTDAVRTGKADVVSIDALARKWGASRIGWTEDLNGVRVWSPDGKPTDDGPVEKPTTPKVAFVADVSWRQWEAGLRPGMLLDQGYAALIAKCTEGSTWVDKHYADWLKASRDVGMPFMAYPFLHRGNAARQADWLAKHILDPSVPVMTDVEDPPGADLGPAWDDVVAFIARCHHNGTEVKLDYIPESYWGEIGRPSLKGSPRVVQAAYPTLAHNYASRLYPGHGNSRWDPYGGVDPTLWQFTSTAKVDGASGNLDVSAFRGSPAQLLKLGLFKTWPNTPNQEDDMTPDELLDTLETPRGQKVLQKALAGLLVDVPPNDRDAIGKTEVRLSNALTRNWRLSKDAAGKAPTPVEGGQ